MARSRKTRKQIKEDAQRKALRMRLSDMAKAAGLLEVDEGEYWAFALEDISRLVNSVHEVFNDQLVNGFDACVLKSHRYLEKYKSLDELTSWLWGLGIR